jgi:Zn-dependent peptidase ImmA (M78 family)/transcriptional regulator with XRE-family HTH domain
MPAMVPVSIQPSVLTWARSESGYAVDRVASRLQVKPEKIEAWERGERMPTLRQVQELARFFHRPLNVFFLPSPPQVPPLAAEYRRLPGVAPGQESPELRLALRQMITRRETALALMEELGETVTPFTLEAHPSEGAASAGARLRAALGITQEAQRGWRDEWQAWREWRAAVEQLGVLVFQFPKVELTDVRGVSLLRFPMPVVGVNSKEQPESRNYTLLHEVVHLMLASGHEETPAINEKRSGSEWEIIERFAEEAASHALVPEDVLRGMVSKRPATWDIAAVKQLARRFRITALAMATRLRASDFMSWQEYNTWKQSWQEFVAKLPKRSGGFAHPVDVALGRNGRPYVQLVLEALAANRITSVDAARHLALKFEHFDKLKTALKGGPSGSMVND